MAEHKVSFTMPTKIVLAKDVTFEVSSGGGKLGELLISKGNVEWVPANHRKRRRLKWEQFAALMTTEGKVIPNS